LSGFVLSVCKDRACDNGPVDIQIKTVDNRITIYNPGELYGNITISDLQKDDYQASARNKLTVEAFYLTGDIEKYGTGIYRITELLLNYGLTAPTFENFQHGFIVTAFAKKIDGNIISINVGIHTNVTENEVEKVVDNVLDNDPGNVVIMPL